MHYFAYASNLNRRQMSERCPDSKPMCRAWLPDHELTFAGQSRRWCGGVATIRVCKGKRVSGAVYQISERDLRSLDTYEGYPTVYARINVTVFTDSGKPVEATTYIMVGQMEEAQPSSQYLDIIRQGYKDWRIET